MYCFHLIVKNPPAFISGVSLALGFAAVLLSALEQPLHLSQMCSNP